MSRFCPISGKKPQSGHNVSHSNRRTKLRFLPNLQTHQVWLDDEKRVVSLRLSAYGIRLVDKLGLKVALEKLKQKQGL